MMDINIPSMFSAGKVIRLLIFILGCLVLFKMWFYLGLSPHILPTVDNENTSNLIVKPSHTDLLEVEVVNKIRVEVYYEALCPDSRHFVMKQLTPAYEKLNSIMYLVLIPYGKASTKEANNVISFKCQHGPVECEANKVHSCVTNVVEDETKRLKIIHCMINNNRFPLVIGKKCVEEMGENWKSVEECTNTNKGNDILKHMGRLTDKLNPRADFIPTITISGSQDNQNQILRDLVPVVCSRYIGVKPPSCS